MKISVLGCGRWGSFIAWYLAGLGHSVVSWGPEDGESYQILKKTGRNEYVTLRDDIRLTCDLSEALSHAEIVVISISAQGLRGFMEKIVRFPVSDKTFVLCMKGIEPNTAICADSPSVMRELLRLNLGIAFIPEYTWHGFAPETVVLRTVRDLPMERFLLLSWEKQVYQTHAWKTCRDIIAEYFLHLQRS